MKLIKILSLDVGSTTSCMMVIQAQLQQSVICGQMQLHNAVVSYKSVPVFTPFQGHSIDIPRLLQQLSLWLQAAELSVQELYSGGVVLTGLSAQAANADELRQTLSKALGPVVIHTVGDPNLESWLAYKGSHAALIKAGGARLNFDIGGGTTNVAFGLGDKVLATGCYFIGARHFQFDPHTGCLVRLSASARRLNEHLGLGLAHGQLVSEEARRRIVDFYIDQLQCIVPAKVCDYLTQVALVLPQALIANLDDSPQITFSGGVGEILSGYFHGQGWPERNRFGDLGVELAIGLFERNMATAAAAVAPKAGRATLYGLAMHNTQVSSRTVFTGPIDSLSITQLPVLGTIDVNTSAAGLESLLQQQVSMGAAVFIDFNDGRAEQVVQRAKMMAQVLAALPASDLPLVYFLGDDMALTFGNYLSRWRRTDHRIWVIDGITERNAAFAHIGKPCDGVIPVSFYGMHRFE